MIWTLFISAALYVLGLLHSIFGFYRKRLVFVRLALGMVGCGFAFHTIFLIHSGLKTRHFPITNLSESLSFFAWCIALVFVVANIRYRISVLGAFVLPFVSALTIFSQLFWDENQALPQLLKSRWIYFHATVAFLAYAAFFLTFIAGVFYLIQEKELKNKRFRFLYFHLPSLQVCDELLRNSLFAGFVAMSLTILTGAFWAQQAWGQFWSWDPKETASLITWGIYLLLVYYRLSSRWRGRAAAYISIIGFVSIICTFGINWGLHAYL
jgi:cytochrome c-type biogenesis protein CcsB